MRSAFVLLSLFVVSACDSSVPEVRVGRLVLDAPRRFDDVSGSRDRLRQRIEQRVRGDETAKMTQGEREATHILHVRIGDELDDEEADVGRRRVFVRLRPTGNAPLFEAYGVGKGEDLVQSSLSGFDDAWAVLVKERKLEIDKDAALIAALEDPDERLRDFAIVRIGDRKVNDAVMPLCKLLDKEPKHELVLRAIGSLVAIGDARAVPPLIALSERKDPDFVLQVVFAVAAIGGRTAEAYLVTMASGHPMEAIRKGAEQALAEMKRK